MWERGGKGGKPFIYLFLRPLGLRCMIKKSALNSCVRGFAFLSPPVAVKKFSGTEYSRYLLSTIPLAVNQLEVASSRWRAGICETQKNVSPPLAYSSFPTFKFSVWIRKSNRNIWGLFIFQSFSLPRLEISILHQHSFYPETIAKMHPLCTEAYSSCALITFTSP